MPFTPQYMQWDFFGMRVGFFISVIGLTNKYLFIDIWNKNSELVHLINC